MVKKSRIVICAGLLLFVLIGFMLLGKKGINEVTYESNGSFTYVETNDELQVKFLGGDLHLYRLEIPTPDADELINADFSFGTPSYDADLQYEEISKDQIQATDDYITVSLQPTKLIYGRDYYLKINLTNFHESKKVRFYSSDEQLSTFINGERIEQGISIKESYENRYSILGMIWKVFFLFLPVLTCCSYFKITNSKYESVAIYLIAVSFIFLISGMAGYLSAGVIVLYLLSVVSIALLLYRIFHLDEEGMQRLVFEAFLPSVFILLFMTVVAFVLDYASSVRMWDDIWHWGLSPKVMYMFDRLPIHARSTLSHFRYLPIYSVCQYGALAVNGRYSETILYMTKRFLEMGLIFGCIPGAKKKKRVIPFVLCLFALISEELFFQVYVFDGLYVDILLGIALAYMLVKLYIYLHEPNRKNLLLLLLSTAYVCMLKDSGWVAVVIVDGLLVLCLLIFKEKRKQTAISVLLGASSVLLTQMSWSTYVNRQFNTNGAAESVYVSTSIAQSSGISSYSLKEFFTGQAPAYKYETIPFHIKKLLVGGDYPTALFAFSFILWCVILLGIFFLLKRKYNHIYSDKVFAVLLPGFVLLEILFMQAAFMFAFPEHEAKVFSGEDRYLGSVLLAILIFLMFYTAQKDILFNRKVLLIVFFALMILTAGAKMTRSRIRLRDYKWLDTPEIGRKIRETISENQKLCYLSKTDDGFRHILIEYEITPSKLNSMYKAIEIYGVAGKRNYPVTGDPGTRQYTASPEELAADMSGFDYLYLEDVDDAFIESYRDVLIKPDTGEALQPYALYQIYHRGEQSIFIKNVWSYDYERETFLTN